MKNLLFSKYEINHGNECSIKNNEYHKSKWIIGNNKNGTINHLICNIEKIKKRQKINKTHDFICKQVKPFLMNNFNSFCYDRGMIPGDYTWLK